MVVDKLVEELGTGGFMGVKDISVGMSIEIGLAASHDKIRTDIVEIAGDEMFIAATSQTKEFLGDTRKKEYTISVVVSNSMYIWNSVTIRKKELEGIEYYVVMPNGNPKVMNRRKHPRLPMNNSCEIVFMKDHKSFKGNLVNISAGGYAFSSVASEFADAVGENIQLIIHNFPEIGDKPLNGLIIRSSNDNGTYIVGCRMPVDNKIIQKYVEERMK
jgi:methyl-accepting chemotaxis protein